MAISGERKRQLWKFLIGGLCLPAFVLLTRDNSQVLPSTKIGEIFGGLLWGWFFWLLWARAYKLALGMATAVVLFVGLMLIVDRYRPFDLAVAANACSAKCQPQWNSQRTNSTSLAYNMTESDVRELCDCTCKSGISLMTQEQMRQLREAKEPNDIRSNSQLRAVFESSFRTCYPRFSRTDR
jgi:hypothetical protein